MPRDTQPTGALVVRASTSDEPFYEAKWRDSTRTQRKRRLGRAWLERGGDGTWVKRKGRVREGYLDERRAHVRMAEVIAEREEDLQAGAVDRKATFDAAAEDWLDYLEHEKRVKPSTLHDYRLMLRAPVRGDDETKARLMRAFGGRKLAGIETRDINRFLSTLDRENVTARTVNKHRQVLHAIFEYARRGDSFGLKVNPVADTEKRPEGGVKPIEIFEPEEVEAIARAARGGLHRERPDHDFSEVTNAEWQRVNDQDAAIFITAAFTGLRMSELRALRWKYVDFAGARITVARAISRTEDSETKSRKYRIVPLSDQVAVELERLSQREVFTGRNDLVFCREDGGLLDRSAMRKRFIRAQRAAGIRVRRFHDLRHTFGSLAVRQFDPVTVQAMMGHSKLSTTERYLHSKPRTDDAARLTSAFSSSPSMPADTNGSEDRQPARSSRASDSDA